MNRIIGYFSLGSNMGNRKENLKKALECIDEIKEISIIKESNVYETMPVGYLEQERFLNMVIKVIVDNLEPESLLHSLQQIENKMGRIKKIKWGPRLIDIDILFLGSLNIKTKELKIPHPEIFKRAFVLVPLSEVYDDAAPFKINFAEAIEICSDKDGIKIYEKLGRFKK